MSRSEWAELGGFRAAAVGGEPVAVWLAQQMTAPLCVVPWVWVASTQGRGLSVLAAFGIGVGMYNVLWMWHLRKDRMPRIAHQHIVLSLTAFSMMLVSSALWIPMMAMIVTMLALVAVDGHRVGQLLLTGVVFLGFLFVNAQDVVPKLGWWAFAATFPPALATVWSFSITVLGQKQRLLQSSLLAADATAWAVDRDGTVAEVFGMPVPEVVPGVCLSELLHPDDKRSAEPEPGSSHEYRIPDGNGGWRWIRESVELRSEATPVYRSGVIDITADRENMAINERRARIDQLTQKANRSDHIRASQRWAEQGEGYLILIDLDRFKQVNDTVGHAIGDGVLRLMSERLSSVGGISHFARLGGDEFAALIHSGEQVDLIADRLVACAADTMQIDGLTVSVGVSAGVARFEPGLEADEIRRRADVALLQAKDDRDGWLWYEPGVDRNRNRQAVLATGLPCAFANDEFVLVHQPKMDLVTGRIVGSEALARWHHPDEGLLLPNDFLDVVLMADEMRRFTRLVLKKALSDLARLSSASAGFVVAVNVDPRNLLEGDFAEAVLAGVEQAGLEPQQLILELTEEAFVVSESVTHETLLRLDEAGVRLSIDDFGTGYSSLAYLGHLPISEIKLDRALVQGLVSSNRDRAIVEAVVGLAKNLDMAVIAEGVEDPETLELLASMGCDQGQGFHIGRPGPLEDLLSVVVSGNAQAAAPQLGGDRVS